MKLSEAILLGSINNGQCYGRLKNHEDKTCAMGAACEGAGIQVVRSCHPNFGIHWMSAGVAIQGMFPILNMKAHHPFSIDYKSVSRVESIIVSLNDGHRWTRPAIAAWVASIEDSLEATPQVVETQELANAIA